MKYKIVKERSFSMNQVGQQVRDILDTLLPVQEMVIELNETGVPLLPAARQELVQFVDEAVRELLAVDCLLTERAANYQAAEEKPMKERRSYEK